LAIVEDEMTEVEKWSSVSSSFKSLESKSLPFESSKLLSFTCDDEDEKKTKSPSLYKAVVEEETTNDVEDETTNIAKKKALLSKSSSSSESCWSWLNFQSVLSSEVAQDGKKKSPSPSSRVSSLFKSSSLKFDGNDDRDSDGENDEPDAEDELASQSSLKLSQEEVVDDEKNQPSSSPEPWQVPSSSLWSLLSKSMSSLLRSPLPEEGADDEMTQWLFDNYCHVVDDEMTDVEKTLVVVNDKDDEYEDGPRKRGDDSCSDVDDENQTSLTLPSSSSHLSKPSSSFQSSKPSSSFASSSSMLPSSSSSMPPSLKRSDSDEEEWAFTRRIFARWEEEEKEEVLKKQKRKENRARYTKEERVQFRLQETDQERKKKWWEKMKKKKRKNKKKQK